MYFCMAFLRVYIIIQYTTFWRRRRLSPTLVNCPYKFSKHIICYIFLYYLYLLCNTILLCYIPSMFIQHFPILVVFIMTYQPTLKITIATIIFIYIIVYSIILSDYLNPIDAYILLCWSIDSIRYS